MNPSRTIYLDNDWIIRRRILAWDQATDTFDPVAGLNAVGLLVANEDDDDNSPITAQLKDVLVERVTGDYFAIIESGYLNAALGTFADEGLPVYEVVSASGDYRDVVRLFVKRGRPPTIVEGQQ